MGVHPPRAISMGTDASIALNKLALRPICRTPHRSAYCHQHIPQNFPSRGEREHLRNIWFSALNTYSQTAFHSVHSRFCTAHHVNPIPSCGYTLLPPRIKTLNSVLRPRPRPRARLNITICSSCH